MNICYIIWISSTNKYHSRNLHTWSLLHISFEALNQLHGVTGPSITILTAPQRKFLLNVPLHR